MPLTRREFLTAGLGVAASFVAGCENQQRRTTPTAVPRRITVEPTAALQTTLTPETWASASAKERLTILERRGLQAASYPELGQFDPIKELTATAAQAFCEQVTCKFTPAELANKVHYLDTATFLEELEKDNKRPLTPQERVRATEIPEFVDRDTRTNIYFNQEGFDARRKADIASGRVASTIQGKDTTTKYQEHTLLHAFSHINSHTLEKAIPPLSLQYSNMPGPVIFTYMKGFQFIGRDPSGNEVVLTGADEAATDFVGRYVGIAQTGEVITSAGSYRNGALMIGDINKLAGISPEEFVRYHSELPIDGLLVKWGSLKDPRNPNTLAALQALAVIAQQTEGSTTEDFMRTTVASLLLPSKAPTRR